MTRVLVVAASPVVRAGLAAVLEQDGRASVVGVDDDAGGLAEALSGASVDVVVWAPASDAAPPPSLDPRGPAVVVLAPRRDAQWAARALARGVRAMLDPEPTAEEIGSAVDAAAHGMVVLAPGLLSTLLARRGDREADAPPEPPRVAPGGGALLTPRELEILGWLAQGLANKQVATRLGVSEHTVKTHLAHVFEKLGVGTRAEAVARAVRLGVLAL